MCRVSLVLSLWAIAAAVPAAASGSEGGGPAPVEAPEASEPHGIRLTLGTGLTMGLTSVEKHASDVVDVRSYAYRWNVILATSWPSSRSWALGARGSWSSDAGARGTESSSLWQLGAEVRQQPRGWLGPYLAASLGGAAARDTVDGQTATQWAPAVGAAVGYDFGIGESLAVGLELRAGAAFFDDDGAFTGTTSSGAATFIYGTNSWLGLNLTGQLGL
jgi:hypothetical protein